MWTRPAKDGHRETARRPAAAIPAADVTPVSDAPVPASSEEHPALLRIRRANKLAEEMRSTGGRHRQET